MTQDFTPERDASLGLVFRLNYLWAQADQAALDGKYDSWNNVLDRIYCNLLYDVPMNIERAKNGEVKKVELPPADTQVYSALSRQIQIAKINFMRAKNPMKKSMARSIWYHSLQKKDIWLRKEMQVLRLYLKIHKKSPGTAMFGDFGKKGM